MMAGFGATRAIRASRPRSPATGSRTNLVFSVSPASFGSVACEADNSWPVSRLLLASCPGEASRATSLPSAIGGASRRYSSVADRRSLAAIACVGRYAEHRGLVFGLRSVRARSARTGTQWRFSPREERSSEVFAFILGAPDACFDGLVSFDDFEMKCNGGDCRSGNHRNGTE